MDNDQPVTPDVQLPGQEEGGAADLEPSIEPEVQQDADGDAAEDAARDPELGNTLIAPGNS